MDLDSKQDTGGTGSEVSLVVSVPDFLCLVSGEIHRMQSVVEGMKVSMSKLDRELLCRAAELNGKAQASANGEQHLTYRTTGLHGPRTLVTMPDLETNRPLVHSTLREGTEDRGLGIIAFENTESDGLGAVASEASAVIISRKKELAAARGDAAPVEAVAIPRCAGDLTQEINEHHAAVKAKRSQKRKEGKVQEKGDESLQDTEGTPGMELAEPLDEALKVVEVGGGLHKIYEHVGLVGSSSATMEELRVQFKRCDTNGDGFLSVQELCAVAHVMGGRVDANNIGEICRQVQRQMALCPPPGEELIEKKDVFLNLDNFVLLRSGKAIDGIKPELNVAAIDLMECLDAEFDLFKMRDNHYRFFKEQRFKLKKLSMDVGIVFVIMINAAIIGISADNNPDAIHWQVVEVIFLLIYTMEFATKVMWLGLRDYFLGPDMSWNCFDFTCLLISTLTEILTMTSGSNSDINWNLLKILRLSRLARLIRLLRFKMFTELKLMLLGLLSGLRALVWALVLLMGLIYILSIMSNSLFKYDLDETSTIFKAMFMLFRCLTDTCETKEGMMIPEFFFDKYGWRFFVAYVIIVMLVAVGLFNLIMAVFIDNVTKSQNQRKQKELGESTNAIETHLKFLLAKFINEVRAGEEDSRPLLQRLSADALKQLGTLTSGFFHHPNEQRQAADMSFKLLRDAGINISRQVFQAWLKDYEFVKVLEDADVDISNRFELFNILDVDHGGELSVDELLNGLMTLRGDVSKGDVVSILLRVRELSKRLEAVGLAAPEEDTQKSASGSAASEV